MKKFVSILGKLLIVLSLFYTSYIYLWQSPEDIDITREFAKKAEQNRLRYFKEISMENIREKYGLTGKNVRVAIMGEMVDPKHADLHGRVYKQYDTYYQNNTLQKGKDNLPYDFNNLSFGDGHGTHIAGTIAANCDKKGIQGIACGVTLDVYSFGGYNQDNGITEISKFIKAFSVALDHIAEENSIKITTGSFNIESPAIEYKDSHRLNGASMVDILTNMPEEINSLEEIIHKKIVILKNTSDIEYIKSFKDTLAVDDYLQFTIGTLLPFSKEWKALEQSIHEYQKSGGVYIVTESNIVLDKTSILNAMPSISPKVDKALWLSVVMVVPKDLESMTSKEISNTKREYITPINNCGSLAYEYCILTPSYNVLSTMTAKVRDKESPMIIVDDRTYQSFSGHSMGAPMVAASLALMQEYNKREGLNYSMKDLVRILKKSAYRGFKGYDPKKHGQGMLDIQNAIRTMK